MTGKLSIIFAVLAIVMVAIISIVVGTSVTAMAEVQNPQPNIEYMFADVTNSVDYTSTQPADQFIGNQGFRVWADDINGVTRTIGYGSTPTVLHAYSTASTASDSYVSFYNNRYDSSEYNIVVYNNNTAWYRLGYTKQVQLDITTLRWTYSSGTIPSGNYNTVWLRNVTIDSTPSITLSWSNALYDGFYNNNVYFNDILYIDMHNIPANANVMVGTLSSEDTIYIIPTGAMDYTVSYIIPLDTTEQSFLARADWTDGEGDHLIYSNTLVSTTVGTDPFASLRTQGYQDGYNAGYTDGISEQINLWPSLLYAVPHTVTELLIGHMDEDINSPNYGHYTGGIFGMDIFGIDMRNVLLTLIGVVILVKLATLIFGGGGKE